MQPDPFMELIRDTLSFLSETPEAFLLSDKVEYDYFRSWALSQSAPKPELIIEAPIIIPKPEIKALPPEPSKEVLQIDPLKELFARIAPQVPLMDNVPSDLEAKKLASRWKTKSQVCPIPILTFYEPLELRRFLEEIGKALSVYFLPSRLIATDAIEKEKQWEAFFSSPDLKILLLCDASLRQLPSLMRYYKEIPTSNTRTLGGHPLILLPDLSLCLKDPKSKRSLWNLLCKKIEPILKS